MILCPICLTKFNSILFISRTYVLIVRLDLLGEILLPRGFNRIVVNDIYAWVLVHLSQCYTNQSRPAILFTVRVPGRSFWPSERIGPQTVSPADRRRLQKGAKK